MPQTNCAVFIKDDDYATPQLEADHLAQISTDLTSWFNFLRMTAGGPPAAMTARHKDGRVEHMLVMEERRVPRSVKTYEDAATLD